MNEKEKTKIENETLQYYRWLISIRLKRLRKNNTNAEVIKELEYHYNFMGDIITENKKRMEEKEWI